MNASGDNETLTASRLAARLASLRGLAPAPTRYVIWRATEQDGAPPVSGYALGESGARADRAAFERWLIQEGITEADRLAVSVLVIRETLDRDGLVRACVLDRRRGAADGPLYGRVARVEFAGPARRVRRYQAAADGRLIDLPADATDAPPPEPMEPEAFAGEDEAVHAALGPGAVILDRRAPNLFEDMAGFSGIIHARRWDGETFGCAVGWHGTLPFVIIGAFPRETGPDVLTPDIAALVTQTAAAHNLIPHEARRDERGVYVVARSRTGPELAVIRLDGATPRIEPYVAGRTGAASEDQRRWMTYAETYESRVILDSWPEGYAGDIGVLTLDRDQEAWCHSIDPDGVEQRRRSGNEMAAAVVARELAAAAQATAAQATAAQTAAAEAAESRMPAGPARSGTTEAAAAEEEIPPDSLLAQVHAYGQVTSLLRAVADACGPSAPRGGAGVPAAALEPLSALPSAMARLNVPFTSGSVTRLARRAEAGAMTLHGFAEALEDIVIRLRDELTLTRVVALSAEAQRVASKYPEAAPLGAAVERCFPAVAYDVVEAVHCLTLRRTTAAVLHAAQVIRRGLIAAERIFGASGLTTLTWANLGETLSAAGAEKPVLDALSALRRQWQGPDLTPAAKYTGEEAESVLDATGALMRALAASQEARGIAAPG